MWKNISFIRNAYAFNRHFSTRLFFMICYAGTRAFISFVTFSPEKGKQQAEEEEKKKSGIESEKIAFKFAHLFTCDLRKEKQKENE